MPRRRDFWSDDGSTSDSSAADDDDDLEYPQPNARDDDAYVGDHRRKRRRMANSKESAALGVFADDSSDDNRPDKRWKKKNLTKNLRKQGMGFVGEGHKPEDDDEEEGFAPRLGIGNSGLGFMKATAEDEEEPEDERPRLGLGGGVSAFSKFKKGLGTGSSGTSTPRSMDAHPGLGFSGGTPRLGTPRGEDLDMEDMTPFGKGFVSSFAKQQAEEPTMEWEEEEEQTFRPSFAAPAPPWRKGKENVPAANPESFAARMMAKMGYKAGEGLGKTGEGRINPIEVKLRPKGVGVGAIKEKTEQEKTEQKRAAALRGEVLSDSDDEKKKRRRRERKKAAGGVTPLREPKKERTKFRTFAEIEANAQGLEIPQGLKSIIDLTGKEQKLLTETAGLMTPTRKEVPEGMKIAKQARRDLEAFAGEWQGMQERKAYIEREEGRIAAELDQQAAALKRLREMADIVKVLKSLSLTRNSDMKSSMEAIVSQLEVLQFEFKDFPTEIIDLSEVAVAALHPLVKTSLADWDPLAEPLLFLDYFQRLRSVLSIHSRDDLEAEYNSTGFLTRHKNTTPYETLISTLWLPRVRIAVNMSWDPHHPGPLLSLFDTWSSILPAFIRANMLSQLILPKLKEAVSKWNPRLERKQKTPPPHVWLFQWLPHLGPHMDDLLRTMRTKFGVVLDTWDLRKGPIPGLDAWRSAFGADALERTLIRHLLPRLAARLHNDFTINPADQDLAPFNECMQWATFFKASTMGKLLEAEFFPKWLEILHLWLTSGTGANYGEVQEWYQWWQGCIPEDLRGTQAVKEGFHRGLQLVNEAMDLGSRVSELPKPEHASTSTTTPKIEEKKKKQPLDIEASFRDVLEDWCVEHNLLLVPLRKAHEKSGLPLFRITASASGKGGVMCYLKGDVVWAAGREKKGEEARFAPVGFEQVLDRVEAR